jgi:hypothetical protein
MHPAAKDKKRREASRRPAPISWINIFQGWTVNSFRHQALVMDVTFVKFTAILVPDGECFYLQ